MIDVRIEKGFSIKDIRLALFVDIKNIFNWTNIIGYDNSNPTSSIIWEASVRGLPEYPNGGVPDPTGVSRRPVGLDGSFFMIFRVKCILV